MKKNRYLAWAVVAAILAWGIYYFVRPEAPAAPKEALPPKAPTILTYEGNTISEEKDGRKVWQITAETIEVDVDSSNVLVKNVKATFYQADGKNVVLTAPQATLDNKSRDISLQGNVNAVNSDGATFTAEQAAWISKQEHFTAKGKVRLTREDTVVTADQLDSDAKMEKIKVQGNARVLKGGAK